MNTTRTLFFSSIICLFFSLFSAGTLRAQREFTFEVIGNVINEKTQSPLESAIVKLLKKQDSTEIVTSVTKKQGFFRLTAPGPGAYIVKIAFIGFTTSYRDVNITLERATADLGKIILSEGISLSGITVTQNVAPLIIKKDTLEYNALAFKTAPNANVENMFRKIAGFEVDQNGNITINGQVLSRLTVENKKFFGDNYKIATQNLPADAIAKIQVIEDKTERAKETGIDDGKREKVVNLILKEDKKGGWFGSGSIAGGSSERYLASGNLNHFTKKIQLNMLAMRNNTNQSYSVGEVGGYGGYDPGPGAVSGMINGIAYGRTGQGLATTNSGAINFSTTWGAKDRNTFSSSYIVSQLSATSEIESAIQSTQQTGIFFSNNFNRSLTDDQTHEFQLYFQSKLDTLTTLTVSPAVSYNQSSGSVTRRIATANSTATPINTGAQQTESYSSIPLIRGSFTLRRQLKQKKGSMALTLSRSYISSNGDNTNVNNSTFYDNNGTGTEELINQWQDLRTTDNVLSAKALFNRVLSKDKKTSIIFNVGANKTTRSSDQFTYDYNPITDLYEFIVPNLTSRYDNNTTQQDAEIGLNTSNDRLTVSTYATLQHINLNGNVNNTQVGEVNREFWTLLPRFTLSYRTPTRKSLTFSINSQLTTPSVVNLQPVQNNNNPLYIRDGNPDLRPSTMYYGNLSYSASNVKTGFYQNYTASYNISQHAFSTSNFFDEATGKTYSQPINVNGNYALSLGGSFGGKFKIKGLGYSFGFTGVTRKAISYVNNEQNETRNLSAGINSSFFYNYEESLYLAATNRTNYIDSRNSVRATTSTAYFSITSTLSGNLKLANKWRFTAEANHLAYAGRGDGFDQSVLIANMGFQRFLMPKDQLILELKGYDLFNQNTSLTRSITDNRIEDTRTMNLRRYVLLKLTYKVNKVGKKG